MKTLALVGKFLQIGLAGLSLIHPLSEEFGSGDHIGAINNSIQSAAALASASTTDANTQSQIAAAAGLASGLVPQVATAVSEIQALIASFEKKSA